MKIPPYLIGPLLAESYSFRSYCAALLGGTSITLAVHQAVNDATDKIPAIKAVRELASEREVEFRLAYPNLEFYNGALGLAASKKLVESLRDFS